MKNLSEYVLNTIDKISDHTPMGSLRRSHFRFVLFSLILLTSWTSSLFIEAKAQKREPAATLQQGIAKEIIRFHVIANSDTKEDQDLKLEIKDALVSYLSPKLKDADSITKAREIIQDKQNEIKKIAEKIIHEKGYNYSTTVSLEPCYFPMKIYGSYTFPPGTYEALRVKIGAASGHNWWCVMFPPLCFVDETYSIVDEDTDKKLKYLLSDEQYETLTSKKVPVKIKFKLWEKVKKLFRA